VSQVRSLAATIYTGEVFAHGSSPVIPADESILAALWCFLSSNEYETAVRLIDKKLAVTNGSLLKVEFDLTKWSAIAADRFPKGLPGACTGDPTQWLFDGTVNQSEAPLQVAVARLVGYAWPRQVGANFLGCAEVGTDDVAGHADHDGIVVLNSVKGEQPAAARLRALLSSAFGANWSAARLDSLLAQIGFAGRTLDDWLRDGFFEQHCELFHQRPFVWHIWDGLRGGFNSLVNYHSLAAPDGAGRRTLEKLTFTYLGDWIGRQKVERNAGKEGADEKLAAATHLQNELKKILEGEPPYDLFVRWKPLQEQATGWNPDLNDGVRMNIRPFMMAETLKGKSIFRKAPKIKWDKDRGKEPERPKRDYPWFWGWDEGEEPDFMGAREFDGNRWNDLHYSNKVKQEARERHKEKKR